MIKFEQVAHPYGREELLATGGAYSPDQNQLHIMDSLSFMAEHLVKDSQYGFLEPKRIIKPEVAKDSNFSLLSGGR